MTPAVVYPVTPAMRLWHEEQFGPLVPVAVLHYPYPYAYPYPYPYPYP